MRLIDADKLMEKVKKWLPPDPCGREEKEFPFETDICVSILMEIEEAPTVDAIPIDWVNLFQSTPIGGDSIDDMMREWRHKLEVETKWAREDGKQT